MQGIPSAGSFFPVGALLAPHPGRPLFPWARGPPPPHLVSLHGTRQVQRATVIALPRSVRPINFRSTGSIMIPVGRKSAPLG